MKRIAKVIIFAMIAFVFAGCGKITRGEIYEMEFREERRWMQMTPIIHTSGNTHWISYIPVWHHTPDEWIIRIRRLDGDDTATYYVTEDVYNDCEVGMLFEYTEERGDLSNEPLEKWEEAM